MIIRVDEKNIEITEEMINTLFSSAMEDVENKYISMDLRIRLAIKTAIRSYVFPYLEKILGKPVRPSKELDPTMYLVSQIIALVEEASKHAIINIETNKSDGETHRPTSLTLSIPNPREGGRQLDVSWTKR